MDFVADPIYVPIPHGTMSNLLMHLLRGDVQPSDRPNLNNLLFSKSLHLFLSSDEVSTLYDFVTDPSFNQWALTHIRRPPEKGGFSYCIFDFELLWRILGWESCFQGAECLWTLQLEGGGKEGMCLDEEGKQGAMDVAHWNNGTQCEESEESIDWNSSQGEGFVDAPDWEPNADTHITSSTDTLKTIPTSWIVSEMLTVAPLTEVRSSEQSIYQTVPNGLRISTDAIIPWAPAEVVSSIEAEIVPSIESLTEISSLGVPTEVVPASIAPTENPPIEALTEIAPTTHTKPHLQATCLRKSGDSTCSCLQPYPSPFIDTILAFLFVAAIAYFMSGSSDDFSDRSSSPEIGETVQPAAATDDSDHEDDDEKSKDPDGRSAGTNTALTMPLTLDPITDTVKSSRSVPIADPLPGPTVDAKSSHEFSTSPPKLVLPGDGSVGSSSTSRTTEPITTTDGYNIASTRLTSKPVTTPNGSDIASSTIPPPDPTTATEGSHSSSSNSL
ncbi:hypothetical protein DL95DRAFT_408448 [Leptodontidium sp. 2 PMI_412]|nr:hypothetical protein DL95DRAFT_408448 [Leptodontidium sp. 2 PMI_412]